jgi:hypothetical protein
MILINNVFETINLLFKPKYFDRKKKKSIY